MTITFQPNMLEDPKFKALITNKEKLNSGHKHPGIFRVDQERNLLTVYYSKL